MDEILLANADHWLVRETILSIKRTLKRLDMTARSLFALIEPGSCLAGTLFELALAADRRTCSTIRIETTRSRCRR